MTVRLLYVSRSNGPHTTTVTRSILEQAKTHNAAQGITGVLCQGQGFFLQVLEGPRSAVNALYRRIVADMRHKDVEMLVFEDIHERRFERWSMALIKLSDQDPMVKLQHPEFDPYSASGDQAMQQLLHWLDSSQPIERLGD
jgi:hypothetical protein